MLKLLFALATLIIAVLSDTPNESKFENKCLEPEITVNKTVDCAWTCIEIFYEKEECMSCINNSSMADIFLSPNPNERFSTLMDFSYARINDSNIRIVASCNDCTPNNAENAGIVSYRRPNDLFEFHTINHTSNATADTLQRLYERISSRTNDSTKYCLDFFNIKPIMTVLNDTKSNITDETTEATTITTTTILNDRIDDTNELSTTTETTPRVDFDSTRFETTNATTTEIKNIYTTVIENVTDIMPKVVNKTEKSNKLNKIATDSFGAPHHYETSLSMILLISTVLLGALAAIAVILRIFIKHRKQHQRGISTDNSIYLFESNE